ncbi:MAG: hypothetical protein HYX34_05990 [Actinobacteria bacterium]|nr:hypothetical protein [Actinomycetota bacterium]
MDSLRVARLIAAVGTVLAGCGSRPMTGPRAGVNAGAASGAPAVALGPESTPGDPRDLIRLTNFGYAQTAVVFSSYPQLRDYSDTAVVARVQRITVASPAASPYLVPGELEVRVTVEAVLGGRFRRVTRGSSLLLVLPLDAPTAIVDQVRSRLDALEGTARFVFFLRQRIEPARDPSLPARFTPIFYGAPPAVLAEWPGDGRLTDLAPHDYLFREAVRRGEARTGTSSPTVDDWAPTFPDQPPIGLTVAGAVARFSAPPGSPQVPPPPGWDRLEQRLAPAS